MASMDMGFDAMMRRNYGTESVKDILAQSEHSYVVKFKKRTTDS